MQCAGYLSFVSYQYSHVCARESASVSARAGAITLDFQEATGSTALLLARRDLDFVFCYPIALILRSAMCTCKDFDSVVFCQCHVA